MSEVTKEDVKKAALEIAHESGSSDVAYTALQQKLGKLALGKLDQLVQELVTDEPGFGEVDDKGTAKKSDDELILHLKGGSDKKEEATPGAETPSAKKPKAAEKKKPTKATKAKKTDKKEAKKDEPQKGIWARIKGMFGR